jgi:hypothetical protein
MTIFLSRNMTMGPTHGSQNSDLFRQEMIHNESSINTGGLLKEYRYTNK